MQAGSTALDSAALSAWVDRVWEEDILPQITEYIRIPNKSPLFDRDWKANGHMDRAFDLAEAWCRARDIPGLVVERIEEEGRTPLLYLEVPGQSDETVLLYGHLDKQPEMVGWREDLGPWKPVREGDLLYGRGGADDGYAVFASLAAVEALQKHGQAHPRCVVIIEGCEESGSVDLPHYVDLLAERIGQVSLVVCLDSGAGDYERLWSTTSLRGMVAGDLRIDILSEGVHSGDASGIVPSSFRILRQLLDRVESAADGSIQLDRFHVEVPEARVEQARVAAAAMGGVADKYPFLAGARPMTDDPVEMILNRTWRPTLSVTGSGGMPALSDAGNVLRPFTAVKLSFRLPPTADWKAATAQVKEAFETDPPSGAKVSFTPEKGANGWDAPALAPWLEDAVARASRAYFGHDPVYMGEGGSIPFMGMLGERFPDAQFLITGVLGPKSNAHGPNEFLHVPCAKKLTCCVAEVLRR